MHLDHVLVLLSVWACTLLFSPQPSRAHGALHQRIEFANRAIAARSDDAGAYLDRAVIHRRHGEFAASLADVDRAAALDPERSGTHFVRGETLLEAGMADEAEAELTRFLELQPEHAAAWAARARARRRLGRPLSAARDFDTAIAQQPVPLPDHYLQRADALTAAGDAHLDEAIRGLEAGIAATGHAIALERAALELEVRRGAIDSALARLDRCAARSPRQERWLERRGEILEQAGRESEALQSFRRALIELEELPQSRRHSVVMARLETRLRESIERLSRKVQ
jgi:predicted Zn-dependent protease